MARLILKTGAFYKIPLSYEELDKRIKLALNTKDRFIELPLGDMGPDFLCITVNLDSIEVYL